MAGRRYGYAEAGPPPLLLLMIDMLEDVEERVLEERRRVRLLAAAAAEMREERVDELGVEGFMREGTLAGRGGEEERRERGVRGAREYGW